MAPWMLESVCSCRAAFKAVPELDFICLLSPNTGVLGGAAAAALLLRGSAVHSREDDVFLCRTGAEGDLPASAASAPSWTSGLRLRLPQEAALAQPPHPPSQVESCTSRVPQHLLSITEYHRGLLLSLFMSRTGV